MAWTTPKTWLAGELVKEGDMNLQVRDNMDILKIALEDDGRITAIDSIRFADLDGSNLVGVALLAAANNWTTGTQNFNGGATTRMIIPVGSDKWAT